MTKLTLCVDFDGVLHLYTSGWYGADSVRDGPTPGAMSWLARVTKDYNVAVSSSRSQHVAGILAMERALKRWLVDELGYEEGWRVFNSLSFPAEKPIAHLYIDDRGYCFQGTFPTVEEIEAFVPWNRERSGVPSRGQQEIEALRILGLEGEGFVYFWTKQALPASDVENVLEIWDPARGTRGSTAGFVTFDPRTGLPMTAFVPAQPLEQ